MNVRHAPTQDDLAADARDALEFIERVMHAISVVSRPTPSERTFLALQLLRASCDHGRALTFLLANNPIDLAGSALALHRAQIENFLRAAFYAQIATQEELEDFFEEDMGPRRKNDRGRWEKIRTEELAKIVQTCLHAIEGVDGADGKLAHMVESAWDPLCGMVHGGRAVHALYRDHREEIGCSVPPEVHVQTTVNTVAMVNFCLSLACTIAGLPHDEEDAALKEPLQKFHEYVEKRAARLHRFGLE